MSARCRYLIVKGCAGLGNRLYTLCSAIVYARRTGRVLVVDWSDGAYGPKGDNVFHHYFSLKGIDTLPSVADIPSSDRPVSSFPSSWGDDPSPAVLDLYQPMQPTGIKRRLIERLLPERVLQHERLKMLHAYFRRKGAPGPFAKTAYYYVKGILDHNNFPRGHMLSSRHDEDIVYYVDYWPNIDQSVLLNNVELKPEVDSAIDRFARQERLSEMAVGVHVRYTDLKPGQSIDSLIEMVKQIQNGSSPPKVFLATDNSEVAGEFSNHFPNVVEHPKLRPNVGEAPLHKWAEAHGQGDLARRILEESIMDMWLLSRCRCLIFQRNSSFSGVSAILHPDPSRVRGWG